MSQANTFKNNDLNLPQIKNPKHLIEQSEDSVVSDFIAESEVKASEYNRTAPACDPIDLEQELAAARQMLQYQQSLINTLTQQLTDSDRRLAQLTQDLTESRQLCDRQQHQLVETEEVCRDLRTQLCRQQQQTLQLKTALEQLPEQKTVAPPSTLEEDFRAVVARKVVTLPPNQVAAPKRPIQPWSSQSPDPIDAYATCERSTLNPPKQDSQPRVQAAPVNRNAAVRSPNQASYQIDLPKFVHF